MSSPHACCQGQALKGFNMQNRGRRAELHRGHLCYSVWRAFKFGRFKRTSSFVEHERCCKAEKPWSITAHVTVSQARQKLHLMRQPDKRSANSQHSPQSCLRARTDRKLVYISPDFRLYWTVAASLQPKCSYHELFLQSYCFHI